MEEIPSGFALDLAKVGLFLEEIAYFMEAQPAAETCVEAAQDMERDLWWLLRMAHQPARAQHLGLEGVLQGAPPALVRGDEQIQPVDAAVEAAIQKLKERADKHGEDHVNQVLERPFKGGLGPEVRAKIVIIPSVDKTECHGMPMSCRFSELNPAPRPHKEPALLTLGFA